MRAGAAKVDITPTKSLFLGGYSARRKKALGMKDPPKREGFNPKLRRGRSRHNHPRPRVLPEELP